MLCRCKRALASRVFSVSGAVILLLSIHASMLMWIGLRNSPGVDEGGHLVSGLSHWKFGRFELYRVNPPLVRALAALPLLLMDVPVDWTEFSESPYARPEFSIGNRFCDISGDKGFFLFTLARWVCIPLSVLGGLVVFAWARALYGQAAGLLALSLWCFSPNVLSNAAMITPDAPAASLGVSAIYLYWRWLKEPSWPRSLGAGFALGLAELTKTTWIVLFGLLPLLWIIWRLTGRRHVECDESKNISSPEIYSPSIAQLATILLLALYVINLGYAFEGSFTPLKKFSFISHALGGPEAHHQPGNRFTGSRLGELPVPVPLNYLKGIDVQRYDFEIGKPSYLLGRQRDRGWWYWYLYALAVKVPVGTWVLLLLAPIAAIRFRRVDADWRDELVLLAPAIAVLVLVSSQTGFSRYVRYVLPMAPFCQIWIGQAARAIGTRARALSAMVVFATVFSVGSSLAAFPHSLSYFNEVAGGPLRGPDHLLDANVDWGQDLLYLKRWHEAHPDARPFFLQYFGFPPSAPQKLDIAYKPVPRLRLEKPTDKAVFDPALQPGWYAISVNDLYGYRHLGSEPPWFSYLLRESPADMAGYSIRIYHLSAAEIERINASVDRHKPQ